MPSKTLKYGLSIDWDYFMPVEPVYDFRSGESPLLYGINDLLWMTRAIDVATHDKDIRDILPIRYNPELFTNFLEDRGIKYSKKMSVAVADSHKHAYQFFVENPVDIVINIDSHHDMVYENEKTVDCDNWLGFLLREGKISRAMQYYPNEEMYKYDWTDTHKKKISKFVTKARGVYHEVSVGNEKLDKEFPKNITIGHVFLCRSSGWTPPWGDSMFKSLALEFLMKAGGNMTLFNFESLDKMNRKFDIESDSFKENVRVQKEMLKQLKESGATVLGVGNV